MATTQESYRFTGRNPRYTTKLNAFSNGMYLTEQVIPEGYVKAMVNYDIDATGSHIKPKRGRKLSQRIIPTETGTTEVLFSPVVFDYINVYDPEGKVVIDTADVALNLKGAGVYYDKESNSLKHINLDRTIVEEDGTRIPYGYAFHMQQKTIENAVAFDKELHFAVNRPTYTVTNNEFYTINTDTDPISLIKLKLHKNYGIDKVNKMKPENPVIYKPNALEAASTGYNMLLDDPFNFENEIGGALTILGGTYHILTPDGFYGEPVLYPELGSNIVIKVNYQYPTTGQELTCKVEICDASNIYSPWETVMEDGYAVTGEVWEIAPITVKYKNMAVRVTATPKGDNTKTTTGTFQIIASNDTNSGIELKKVNLLSGKQMISWFGYTGIYNVENAEDTIFFSDIDNPGYFPFPNNILQFDNKILAVHNYLDYLLVVTVDSMYLVSIGDSIITSTQKKIMTNIYIPEVDAINLVVLKDQIFFKTADQFYVLKPNNYTSDATDLKNYVISTAIDNLTKNFTRETVKLLNATFKTTCEELTEIHKQKIQIIDFRVDDVYSSIVEQEVHYIYIIKPIYNNNVTGIIRDGKYNEASDLQMHLVYDTLVRSWRIYFVISGENHWIQDADTGHLISVGMNKPLYYRNKQTGVYYEFYLVQDPYLMTPENTSEAFVQADLDWLTDEYRANNRLILLDTPEKREKYKKFMFKVGPFGEPGVGLYDPDKESIGLAELTMLSRAINDQINILGLPDAYLTLRPDMNNVLNTMLVFELTYESNTDNYEYSEGLRLSEFYDNYNYIDTGIIAIEDIFTKRFREVQLNLVNCEKTMIPFHVDFKLDGQERVSATHFRIQHITDVNDPDYGLIYVTPIETDNLKLYGETNLANDIIESDHWKLDLSRFPDLTMVTVRFELKGRGRHASLQLLNTSLKRYELADINWVYRMMNAR